MSEGSGNKEMVRIIAEQLFTVWEERQGKRSASWPAWGGLVLSILGIAYVAGSLTGNIAEANSRCQTARGNHRCDARPS